MKRKLSKESKTNRARVRAMTDDNIDFSDIPRTTLEFWKNAFVRKGFKPLPKKSQANVPIDKDIIEFFQSQNFNYPARINEVLRAYIENDKAEYE